MKNDLILKYKFTDRAGRWVYDICEDYQNEPIGEIRLNAHDVDVAGNGLWLEWVPGQDEEQK